MLVAASVSRAADRLVGVVEVPLVTGGWFDSEAGASAAEGGTKLTDAVAEALAVTGADDVPGATLAGLLAVDVTGGSVVEGATTRGAGDSALVVGGFTVVVGGAEASDGVMTGAVVAAGGSGAWVWDGGSTLLGAGSVAGVVGDADDGASAAVVSSGISTSSGSSGSGTGTVVVGVIGSVFGSAIAGATPPVSAVSEITNPDASTATMVCVEQISSGARTCIDSYDIKERGGFPPLLPCAASSPNAGACTSSCALRGAGAAPVAAPHTSEDSSPDWRIRYSF